MQVECMKILVMTVDFIVMFASNRFYFLQFLYLDKYNNPHISKTCVC